MKGRTVVQDGRSYWVYTPEDGESVDTACFGKLAKSEGIFLPTIVQANDRTELYYDVTELMPLVRYLSENPDREKLFTALGEIADRMLCAIALGVEPSCRCEYIWMDTTACKVVLLCLPAGKRESLAEYRDFLWTILNTPHMHPDGQAFLRKMQYVPLRAEGSQLFWEIMQAEIKEELGDTKCGYVCNARPSVESLMREVGASSMPPSRGSSRGRGMPQYGKGMTVPPEAEMRREMRQSSEKAVPKPKTSLVEKMRMWYKGRELRSIDRLRRVPAVDKVRFSALSPARMQAGRYAKIEIWMYEEAKRHLVDAAKQAMGKSVQETESGVYEAPHGCRVAISLICNEFSHEEMVEERIWTGDALDFSFACKVPVDCRQEQLGFCATVYIGGVIATRLRFTVDCAAGDQTLAIERKDVHSVFMSYASADRNTVLSLVRGMQTARPDLDIFIDVDKLRRGEDWQAALCREIDARDVLYLCWSENASKSEWVEKEWRYAYDKKGIDCIEPLPIESAEKCPPPRELEKKHFNDRLLYYMK